MTNRESSTMPDRGDEKRPRTRVVNARAERLRLKADEAQRRADQLSVRAKQAEYVAELAERKARRGMPHPPASAMPSAIEWTDPSGNLALAGFVDATTEPRFTALPGALSQPHITDVLLRTSLACGVDSNNILIVSRRQGTRAGAKMPLLDLYHHYNPRANEAWKTTNGAIFNKPLKAWSIPDGLPTWEIIGPALSQLFAFIIDVNSMTVLQNTNTIAADDSANDPLLFVLMKDAIEVAVADLVRGPPWRYYVHTGQSFVPISNEAKIDTHCSKLLFRESHADSKPSLRLLDTRTLKGPWHYLDSKEAFCLQGAYVETWRRLGETCSVVIQEPDAGIRR